MAEVPDGLDVDNSLTARRASRVPRGTEPDSDAPAIAENAGKHAGASASNPPQPSGESQTFHTVRILMGERPADTALELDGRELANVERFTLTSAAGDANPATLTLVRIVSREEAAFRGVLVERDDAPRVADDYTTAETSIDVAGVVRVVEESARASLMLERDPAALHAFMIRGDDGGTSTLGELVRDAERYRALRQHLEQHLAGLTFQMFGDGTGDSIATGAALDEETDALRARSLHHDEPRRPL